MDMKEEAQRLRQEIQELLGQTMDKNLSYIKAYQRIDRKLASEIKQLDRRPQDQGKRPTSNIPHLKAVLKAVKESNGVQETMCMMKKYGIVIDVVCDMGRTWKKVIARSAQASHLVWAGRGQYGTKDVTRLINKYLRAAEDLCEFSPPRVVCVFSNGVTHEMASYLEGMGATVEGERVNISEDTARRLRGLEDLDDSEAELNSQTSQDETEDESNLHPDIDELTKQVLQMDKEKKIFLDVTTMVIYVSDVCNGGANFLFKDQTMYEQAKQELEQPVKPFLDSQMSNKAWITCETAINNFKSFMEALGGPAEKERGRALLEKLLVVQDMVSPKYQNLRIAAKVKPKARTIFGTADSLQCQILTSNEAFVRAAAAQGVNPAAILHQSRALSELIRLSETEGQS